MLNYIKQLIPNIPTDWLELTTHRLDIYVEKLAKVQFLEGLEALYKENNASLSALQNLPTAYDYIRLGHPLSCVLEWAIAVDNNLDADHIISFSSRMTPILAVLRKNLLDNKDTQIYYTGDLPHFFDADVLKRIYGYQFQLKQVNGVADITEQSSSTIYIIQDGNISNFKRMPYVDFLVNMHDRYGSIIAVNGGRNADYISEIQHVRRRETIAMTPSNCLEVLKMIIDSREPMVHDDIAVSEATVIECIKDISGVESKALVASSGLSIQYAIMMGLIHHAQDRCGAKDIKFIVPTNCYGGTNDQARRVAACLEQVEVVDLHVDDGQEMSQSLDIILAHIAEKDAIPYIIAEIPTNPRVEVPHLAKLKAVLIKERTTSQGNRAILPVFILDQTFCPNVQFLGQEKTLSSSMAISYASGSKFPSGGKCTAGYCIGNEKAKSLMPLIEQHLLLCDNQATHLQMNILAQRLPSMNQRIKKAYINTCEYVRFIYKVLPCVEINFVSEKLARDGFTPSVFSLDLPTKGDTEEEKEAYKRALNLKLIRFMITEIPNESKFCVSYGQLKGVYWTVPATSTQGTTKEGDKDYIVRAALSANMDMDRHKKVFLDFVNSI